MHIVQHTLVDEENSSKHADFLENVWKTEIYWNI